jgi:hypothetical protein
VSDLFGTSWWSNTELAEVFGISPQRLGVLCRQGVVPMPENGLHDPKVAVAAYIRHLKTKEEGSSKAGEEVKKIQLENEMRQIRLQKIAGELVPVARVAKDWFEVTRRVRDGLLNLPSRLSGVFAAESSQEKIFDSFTKEIHTVLHELANGQTVPAVEQMMLDAPAAAPIEHPVDVGRSRPLRTPDEIDTTSGESERFAMGD